MIGPIINLLLTGYVDAATGVID